MTIEEAEVPTIISEKIMTPGRLSVIFGQIGEVSADTIICPMNNTFTLEGTPEQNSIENTYGAEVFEEASVIAQDYRDGIKRTGIGNPSVLPMGFSRTTNASENDNGVRNIVHVNTNGGDLLLKNVIPAVTNNAIFEADLYKNAHTVAIPVMANYTKGEISFQDALKLTIKGVTEYLDRHDDTGIEQVQIVINADDNEQNSISIQSLTQTNKI